MIEQAKQVLKEAGYIINFWHRDNIIEYAKSNNIELSINQVNEVVSLLENKADANIGINWDTIEAFTDVVLGRWTLTDPSCNQYGRKISHEKYEFKEDRVVDPKTKESTLYTAEIDLSDYTKEEIQSALDTYGHDIEETSDWIKAECLFELEN